MEIICSIVSQGNLQEKDIVKDDGTTTIKAEDDLEFRAERKTGISSQEEIAKTAAGKIYRTVGEQKRSMVAHIVIPEKEADVPAFLHEAVTKLTAGMQSKSKAKIPASSGPRSGPCSST